MSERKQYKRKQYSSEFKGEAVQQRSTGSLLRQQSSGKMAGRRLVRTYKIESLKKLFPARFGVFEGVLKQVSFVWE